MKIIKNCGLTNQAGSYLLDSYLQKRRLIININDKQTFQSLFKIVK